MGQVAIEKVSFAEYKAASLVDPTSTQAQILMRLFEAKGIVIRNDQPAPPADVFTDEEHECFVIRQEQ